MKEPFFKIDPSEFNVSGGVAPKPGAGAPTPQKPPAPQPEDAAAERQMPLGPAQPEAAMPDPEEPMFRIPSPMQIRAAAENGASRALFQAVLIQDRDFEFNDNTGYYAHPQTYTLQKGAVVDVYAVYNRTSFQNGFGSTVPMFIIFHDSLPSFTECSPWLCRPMD